MKNNTLLAALLLAGAAACHPAHALTDAEIQRTFDQVQRDQDRSIQMQERYIRESNDGYDRLQREFDRETIRNEQRRLDDSYYYHQQRRERKGY